MSKDEIASKITAGKTSLGIELGSTRIKAVLVTDDFQVVATGSYTWENQLRDQIWTYDLETVWIGIQASFTEVKQAVLTQFNVPLTTIGAIGVSAMMHGYLAFDHQNQLLTPFRTWRNNITGAASEQLSALFNFNIPERWSIAHLYQAILNHEAHVADLGFMTTLAGYVHWQLSGEKNLGIGDASGMFPIDATTGTWDAHYLAQFEALPDVKTYDWNLASLLPTPLPAGQTAGVLTATGAKLLDPAGQLQAGSLMAPPEGDAGTGMVATNSVKVNTGNISVGTSAFSMLVLNRSLKKAYRDIDMVSTPDGLPVAMVHTNNCSSDINAWVGLFDEFAQLIGAPQRPDKLYAALFNHTESGDANGGALLNYAYLSGENITRVQDGRPLFVRTPHSHFNLANFFKVQLFSAFAPLKIGMDILTKQEGLTATSMIAQGGLFRTPRIGQQVLADALGTPITVMKNASEGGPWGMAVLAQYTADGATLPLADYLNQRVFKNEDQTTLTPTPAGVTGYNQFIDAYQAGLPVELQAGSAITSVEHA